MNKLQNIFIAFFLFSNIVYTQYSVKIRIGEISITNPVPAGHEWKCHLYADIFDSQNNLIQAPSGTTYYWLQNLCNGNGFTAWSTSPSILCDGMISQTYQPKCDYSLEFQTYKVMVIVTINGNEYESEIVRVPDNYSNTLTQTIVTVNQERSDQSSVGLVGKKIDEYIYNYPAGFIHYLPSNIGQEIFKASQGIVNNPYEKYNHWESITDVINHKFINISGSAKTITSKFENIYDATIFNYSAEGKFSISGIIKFFDPWLVNDTSDPLGPKNKGMLADYLDLQYSTNNIGINTPYQGVFLNQGWPNWDPPYYSVKADYVQDIPLQQTGRTHKFYFQGWSASPVGSATFQDSSALETPVVFKQANATVQAILYF